MYLFADLETTGLDPVEDRIIEVAWILTDEGYTVRTGPYSRVVTIDQHTWDLIKANQFIQGMHGPTGLLADLTGDTVRLEDIEQRILDDIAAGASPDEKVEIAGNSAHFDLLFIQNHMPRLFERLHYRVHNIATLIEFFEASGIYHEVKNPRQHRASDDIIHSLAVARFYQAHVNGMIADLAVSA